MAQAPKSTQKKTSTAKKTTAAKSDIRRVAIIGGNRVPFARSNTAYSKVSNQELLTSALRGLVDRFGLEGQRLGEVVAGAVIKHSRDFNLTRESALSSGLAPETPAYDIQQACGTGLEAAILVANKIALGQIECGIAGGTDTTSDAPIGVGEGLREILLDLNRAKTAGERLKPERGCPWGGTVRLPPASGPSPATSRTSWPMRAIRNWHPRMMKVFSRT